MSPLCAFLALTLVHALLASPVAVVDERGQPLNPNALPAVPGKCDFHCTRMDSAVCAGNGQCQQRFQSECAMEAFNCRHPLKPFAIISDALCEQSWAPLCQAHELGNE